MWESAKGWRGGRMGCMEPETPDQEMARIWGEREALRRELIGLPDTIQGYIRGDEISARMAKLRARYKELGGVLYGDDPEEGDSEGDA